MVYKVDISYEIRGFGRYEQTILHGYEKGESFFLGNRGGHKILIKDIADEKVVLELENDSKLFFPNSKQRNIVELGIDEEVRPLLPITPSPTYTIKLTDIRKVEKLYYQ